MVPKRFQANCEMCGMPLDIRRPGIHQYTAGWVENRSAGGGHAIRVPQRFMRFSCKPCVDREAAGAPPFQGSLFA